MAVPDINRLPIPPDIIAHYAQGVATAEECRIVEYMLHSQVFDHFQQMLDERVSEGQAESVTWMGENIMHMQSDHDAIRAIYGPDTYEHMAPETLALFRRAEQTTIDMILAFGYDAYKDLLEAHSAMCARVRAAHIANGGTPPEQIAPEKRHVLEVLADAIRIRLNSAQ